MSTKTIASLVVTLGANSAQLVTELNKSKKGVNKWASDIRSKSSAVATALTATTIAAGATIVAIVNAQSAEIDRLAKKASELDVDTSALQKLRYQAELTGVATEGMDTALGKMLKTISDGKRGLSTAVDAFDALGLKAEDLDKLTTDQKFYAISEAFGNVESQADKTRVAMDVFGRAGRNLLNTLGSDLNASAAEFDKLGISITSQQAAMVEAYEDSKTKLGTIWDGFLNQVTVRVAPAFQDLIEYITETTVASGGMGNVAVTVMESIASGAAFISDSFRGIRLVATTAWLGITKLSAMLIETVRSLESVYIDIMALAGKEIKPSVSLQIDAEAEKMKIGQMQKDIDEMLNGELASTKVQKYFAGLNDRMNSAASLTTATDVTKSNTDTTQANTTATNKLTDELKKSTSAGGAWEKIFGQTATGEKRNLKVSQPFRDAARSLKTAIDGQNTRDIARFLERAQQSLDAAARRGGNGLTFGSERTSDIDGMQAVLDRLVNQIDKQPEKVGSIDINVTADGKSLTGKLMGEPAFLKQLKQFVDNSTKETARAVAR